MGTIDSITNKEKYLLRNKKDVLSKLSLLAKSKCLLTGRCNGGKYSFLTLILKILEDRDLLILDYGRKEALNRAILACNRVGFTTEYEGVKTQFSVVKVHKAKLKGQPVFAASLPDTLLWQQRRECFRVKVPLNDSIRCEVDTGSERITFKVLDISATGIALLDHKLYFKEDTAAPANLTQCVLKLPDIGDETVSMEMKNRIPANKNRPSSEQRVGFAFKNLNYGTEFKIQKYMQSIERQRLWIEKKPRECS